MTRGRPSRLRCFIQGGSAAAGRWQLAMTGGRDSQRGQMAGGTA
jgi:hypothetical protein